MCNVYNASTGLYHPPGSNYTNSLPPLGLNYPRYLLPVVLLVAYLVHFYAWELRNWPKGPGRTPFQPQPNPPTDPNGCLVPLPVVGNLLQVDIANPHLSFTMWRARYGNIYTVWAPIPMVVIAEYSELKKALKDKCECGQAGQDF